MTQKLIDPKNLNDSQFDIGTLVANKISIVINGVLLDDVLSELQTKIEECCSATSVLGCGLLEFADYFTLEEFKEEADAMGNNYWKVEIGAVANGGTSNGSVQVDFLDPVITNKSEWYASFVALVNSFPNWSMLLVQDELATSNNKPQYKIEYTGTVADTMEWKYSKPDGTGDYYSMSVDANGTVVTQALENGNTPFGTDPWGTC